MKPGLVRIRGTEPMRLMDVGYDIVLEGFAQQAALQMLRRRAPPQIITADNTTHLIRAGRKGCQGEEGDLSVNNDNGHLSHTSPSARR